MISTTKIYFECEPLSNSSSYLILENHSKFWNSMISSDFAQPGTKNQLKLCQLPWKVLFEPGHFSYKFSL